MKKTYYILFVLLILVTNANAQFEGHYNLHDGGVDVPSSSLFILPSSEFMLFYYGGYKAGKWRQIDKNNIALTETRTKTKSIAMYGSSSTKKNEIAINVGSLADAHAFINFSKDTINNKDFQPVFNDSPNCLGSEYLIKKKLGEYNWATITLSLNSQAGRNPSIYPYKAFSYTFPLNKQHTDYVVLYNKEALTPNLNFTLGKKNNEYTIDGNQQLKREDLTDELLKKMNNSKKIIDNENDTKKYGNAILYSVKENVIYKPKIKPIFIVKCAGDKNESTATDEDEKLPKLTPTNRNNGFYTVVNYDYPSSDVSKYELAKKPSITMSDILSVHKVISNYGGYEITIVFTEAGKLKFKELTERNIRKPIAIVVNNVIVSAPIINSTISGGKANISDGFSEKQIDELIKNLKE
ncbi:hypothetical protein ABIB40_003777 [Pedobacter sp. UYP30]|uniref:SecDF P1 head subdomain-containing protein n=1 Tax=Pedobacter sp. UYP30 TaxID=1756400 RepID=UPI003399D7F8